MVQINATWEDEMPTLEVVSRSDAELRTASRARAEALREYIAFIEQLKGDQAGKLQAKGGETLRTVRRRLGDAGRLAGKELVIKCDSEVIYFWLKTSGRRRGRPRKASG
jgi:hypothetical protein